MIFIFALMFCFNVKAQTSLTEAVDFTSVALNGEEIHLFDILDNGQYVLIEFFYSSTSGALTYVNKMIESYEYFGCNQHDVFYMQISRYDNKAEAQAWCNEYGIMFPTIHTESEGDTGDEICETYGIPSYPTIVLIAPDHHIVLQDIWPVMYTDDIINALTPFGIEEYECSEILPEVTITVDKTTSSVVEARFSPNITCSSYYYMIGEGNSLEEQDLPIEQILQEQGEQNSGIYTHIWSDLEAETSYNIYALPVNAEGTSGELSKMMVTTTAASGPSVIEIEVEVKSETSVFTKATPNENTTEYHYGVFKKSEYDELGENTIIEILLADGYPLSEIDEWTWEELAPKTDYYVIAVGINFDETIGEPTIVPFRTELESLDEIKNYNFTINPNPAKEIISIISNIVTATDVMIYDMTGRCVKNVIIDYSNATINIEDLKQGVYIININDKVEKLVVE